MKQRYSKIVSEKGADAPAPYVANKDTLTLVAQLAFQFWAAGSYELGEWKWKSEKERMKAEWLAENCDRRIFDALTYRMHEIGALILGLPTPSDK